MMINLLKLNLVTSVKRNMSIPRKLLVASIMSIALVTVAQAGIEYSIRQSETAPEAGNNRFTIFARSTQAISGVQSMVSSAQVSVLIPLDADLNAASSGVLASQNGIWQVNSWNGSKGAGNSGQTEQPENRVMSIGQVALGAKIEFAEAGTELPLFDFSLGDCLAGQGVVIVNNQNDPDGSADAITSVPNSAGSNASNSWAGVLGELYENNYPIANSTVSCH